jgi:hypothetical protein
MEKRKHELEKYKSIWLTEESYKLLRKEKPKQEKSLMRLVDDLIKQKYESSRHI